MSQNPYKEEIHRVEYAMSFLSDRIPSGEIFPAGPNEGDQFRLTASDRVHVYVNGGWQPGMTLTEMAVLLAEANKMEFDKIGKE